jgi:hypothetical protein
MCGNSCSGAEGGDELLDLADMTPRALSPGGTQSFMVVDEGARCAVTRGEAGVR